MLLFLSRANVSKIGFFVWADFPTRQDAEVCGSVSSLKCNTYKDAATFSAGVSYPSRHRGLRFSLAAIQSQSYCVEFFMSEPFGRYCRISPLVFSLVPRSHEWYGVAK